MLEKILCRGKVMYLSVELGICSQAQYSFFPLYIPNILLFMSVNHRASMRGICGSLTGPVPCCPWHVSHHPVDFDAWECGCPGEVHATLYPSSFHFEAAHRTKGTGFSLLKANSRRSCFVPFKSRLISEASKPKEEAGSSHVTPTASQNPIIFKGQIPST